MRVRWLGVAVGVACLGPLTVAAASGADSSLPLTQRVLAAGQFAGMRPSKPPVVVRSAAAWAQGDKTQEGQLRHWGFVAGVSEQMVTPGNTNRYGLSFVIELSSPANAEAALKADYTSNGPWMHFDVPAIPGAVGFEQVPSDQSGGGRNVGFTLGPYAYLVGAG